MRFDCLLWQCLKPGTVKAEDAGIVVELSPEAGETVLMFETDSIAFRGGKGNVKACDLFYFYSGPRSKVPVLLFVELKGSRPEEKAHTQVASTVKLVLAALDASCSGADPTKVGEDPSLAKEDHVVVRSIVVLGHAAPDQTKQERKALFKEHRMFFEYRHNPRDGSVTNLRDLLP